MLQIILLFTITLFAYFTKGITGFGNTLIMNSLFSFLKENRFTTPVDLLLSLPANIYLAWKNRNRIAWRVVLPLSIAVVVGNIPGIFLLSAGSDRTLKIMLGVVLIGLSLPIFANPSARKQEDGQSKLNYHRLKPVGSLADWKSAKEPGYKPEATVKLKHSAKAEGMYPVVEKINPAAGVWLIGLISGVLMGLYGIGALLATYIARHADSRRDYRGNLCFVFVIDNLFRLGGYWFRGILTRQVWIHLLFLAPAAVTGMLLSAKADARIGENAIKKLVMIMLAISGMILVFHNIEIFK